MQQEGPILESMTRRLAETPDDFLAPPRGGASGRVSTAAVVGDLVRLLGGTASPAQLAPFGGTGDARHLAVVQILCWLLSDEWFQHIRPGADSILQLLAVEAAEVVRYAPPRKFTTDPDRREELARLSLARLGFRPAGETPAQAQDRLTTLNSAERDRVMKASRAAEERARQIREALIRKAADESADKWTRE
jgi:hypothetical protein